VTIIVAVPLVAAGGIAGAAVGMIITQVILLVVASLGYRRVLTVTRNSLESKYAAYKPAIADTL
jgi:hypothetical protein